jgi:hypothetical protein
MLATWVRRWFAWQCSAHVASDERTGLATSPFRLVRLVRLRSLTVQAMATNDLIGLRRRRGVGQTEAGLTGLEADEDGWVVSEVGSPWPSATVRPTSGSRRRVAWPHWTHHQHHTARPPHRRRKERDIPPSDVSRTGWQPARRERHPGP